MIRIGPELVSRARAGEKDALEALVRAIERPIFNLAMRMLATRADAEDATQEILILIVTRLSGLRDPEAAGAWALRISVRHLVSWRQRSAIERSRLSFHGFAEDLAADLTGDMREDLETRALANEVRIGCTLALLTCLSRPLRMAYILGEIFELADVEAAAALGVKPATFRQRLKRARTAVETFLRGHCGLVAKDVRCACERRVPKALRLGRVSASPRPEGGFDLERVRSEIARLETAQSAVHLMRANPEFTSNAAIRVIEALEPRP